jgi:beta-phosphoglucomutase-like phosphatase (HAD superfamily)
MAAWVVVVSYQKKKKTSRKCSCRHFLQRPSLNICTNKRPSYLYKVYKSEHRWTRTTCVFLPDEEEEKQPPTNPMWNEEEQLDSTLQKDDQSVEDKYDTWASRKKNAFQRNTPWQLLVEQLNSMYTPDYLQRLYYRNEPIEEFGAILTLEGFLSDAFALELEAWNQVSQEFQLEPVTADDLSFTEGMPREMIVERRLFWSNDWGEINKYAFRQAEIFYDIIKTQKLCLRPGAKSWVEQLSKYQVPIAVTTGLDPRTAEEIVQQWELTSLVQSLVNREECENLQQELLLAASRIQRAPRFCVVFDNTPRAMVAAHDVTSKAVALLGRYKAYDLKVADMIIRDIDQLKISDMAALFGDVAKDSETVVGGPPPFLG